MQITNKCFRTSKILSILVGILFLLLSLVSDSIVSRYAIRVSRRNRGKRQYLDNCRSRGGDSQQRRGAYWVSCIVPHCKPKHFHRKRARASRYERACNESLVASTSVDPLSRRTSSLIAPHYGNRFTRENIWLPSTPFFLFFPFLPIYPPIIRR